MVYKIQNDKERSFFKQDFSPINKLLNRIRIALTSDESIICKDLDLSNILDFKSNKTFIYVSLFQAGSKTIRWGACKTSLEETLNRIIYKIKSHKNFNTFNPKDSKKCRIMLEYLIEETPVELNNIKTKTFCDTRFEAGITGLKLNFQKNNYYYMPTDAWINSQMTLKTALNTLLRKTSIKDLTNKISERIDILSNSPHQLFLTKSRAFITYNNEILPLYRGNIFQEFSIEEIKNEALAGADWILEYQKENGQFLYYYDAKEDNYIDHEHPSRSEDNLYYNDLRHCGGIVTLIRAYQLTKDKKYLIGAKKGIDFITTITKVHDYNEELASFVFYNNKAKLGGTGMILIAMMKYRNETNDKSFDEYIKNYTRHLLSQIHTTGEFFGYYIHPLVQNGQPLTNLTEEERRQTFSFYYPGEALLGLALFANHFKDDEKLRNEVLQKCKLALDWIVDERPKIYADLFTELPSDAWLMQAIEEWLNIPDFQKDNYINFVYSDACTMIAKTYKKDDSPYLDYEGCYYYNKGDSFYPDGSRSEGLIAAYYIAKKLNNKELADKIFENCKLTAKSQMILFNNDKNTYAHKNPKKSKNAIRFKATRQWIRVDSIQHVACFYFRLYFAEKNIEVL